MNYAFADEINIEGEVIAETAQAQTTTHTDDALLDAYSRAVIEAAEKVSPSVVYIHVITSWPTRIVCESPSCAGTRFGAVMRMIRGVQKLTFDVVPQEVR